MGIVGSVVFGVFGLVWAAGQSAPPLVSLGLGEPVGEPFEGAEFVVAAMGGITSDGVTLVFVNDEFCGDIEVLKSVPPFDRLGGGDFSVAIADKDERRGFDVLDEVHGVALGVDSGIVVHGAAEERDHPLVDVVLAVVTEPVGESSTGDGGGEAGGLGFRPHGHVSTVAVAVDAEAFGVDWVFAGEGVDGRHDVAIVTASEVFDIGLGEGLALSVGAAGVGAENEIAHGGEGAVAAGA